MTSHLRACVAALTLALASVVTAQTSTSAPTAPIPPQLSPSLQFRRTPKAELLLWQPKSAGLAEPLLSPEAQKTFDDQFGGEISRASKGTPAEAAALVDLLANSAARLQYSDPPLSMALRGEAFRAARNARLPLPRRAALAASAAGPANTVLQAVPFDRSIAACQLRAEVLADLLKDAGTSALPALQDAFAAAHLRLAVANLHAGRTREALAAIAAAKPFAEGRDRTHSLFYANIAELGTHYTRAAAEYARARETLLANPADAPANTSIATLYLALHADLTAAAPFAAKSNRPSLMLCATLVARRDKLSDLSIYNRDVWDNAEALVACLRDIAQETRDAIDRLLIAEYALSYGRRIAATKPVGLDPARSIAIATTVEKLEQLVKARPASVPAYTDHPHHIPRPLVKGEK